MCCLGLRHNFSSKEQASFNFVAATSHLLSHVSRVQLFYPIDGSLPCSRPWDSPGKNTGVGCHFLLQCMKVKSESEVAPSCPTLSNPMDCSLPGSSVHGVPQARVLEWGAIAFSGNLPYLYPYAQLLPWYLQVNNVLSSPCVILDCLYVY